MGVHLQDCSFFFNELPRSVYSGVSPLNTQLGSYLSDACIGEFFRLKGREVILIRGDIKFKSNVDD